MKSVLIIGAALVALYGWFAWLYFAPEKKPLKDPRAYCSNVQRPNPICDGKTP